MLKTLMTAVGYVRTLIARKLPARLRLKEITSIFNFIPIDDRVATAGQPTEQQLAAIKQAGYDVVINLAETPRTKNHTSPGVRFSVAKPSHLPLGSQSGKPPCYSRRGTLRGRRVDYRSNELADNTTSRFLK